VSLDINKIVIENNKCVDLHLFDESSEFFILMSKFHEVQAYAVPSAPADDNEYCNPHDKNVFQYARIEWPKINEAGARYFLSKHKWPPGLQDVFLTRLRKLPIRFMICDDSGSMSAGDGHKLVGNTLVNCSRWSELTEAFSFHSQLASAASAVTEIRLLNGVEPLKFGEDAGQDETAAAALRALFEDSPSGATPLCRHIREVAAEVSGGLLLIDSFTRCIPKLFIHSTLTLTHSLTHSVLHYLAQ